MKENIQTRPGWFRPLRLAIVLLLLVALAPGTISTTWARPSPQGDDGEKDGSGESYYGPIPAREAAPTEAFQPTPRPAWEWPLWLLWQPPKYAAGIVLETLTFTLGEAFKNRRIFRAYDFVTLKWLPFVGAFSFSSGGGEGFSVGYRAERIDALGGNHKLKFAGRYSTRNYSKLHLGAFFNPGQANSLEIGAGYRQKPNSRFYGLGPQSPDVETFFTAEDTWAGAAYHRELTSSGLMLYLGGGYSISSSRGPDEDEDPALEEIFEMGERPFGLGEESKGFTAAIGLSHDDTLVEGRPVRGGLRRLWGSIFEGNDDLDVSFTSWRAEAQQFVPLWFTRRALGLRGVATRMVSKGDDPIPFQRLMTNDDADLFRGFKDERFRGNGLVALSAEYRWPVWSVRTIDGVGLDAYTFFDWAQVFDETNEISVSNMTESYGGGFRLTLTESLVGRIEIGLSDEDTIFRISADQTFQYGKSGLYNGTDLIPIR